MSAQVNATASRRLRRTAESARISDRLSLVPHRSMPARRAPFITLIVVILAGGVFGLLMLNTQMQQRAFAITRLQQQADALNAQVQGLRMNQQTMEDPQHLAATARALGMVVPPNPTFVELRTGHVSGVPVIASMNDAMQIRQRATPKPSQLDLPPRIVRVKATTPPVTSPATSTATQTHTSAAKKSSTTGAASTGARSTQGRNVRTGKHR